MSKRQAFLAAYMGKEAADVVPPQQGATPTDAVKAALEKLRQIAAQNPDLLATLTGAAGGAGLGALVAPSGMGAVGAGAGAVAGGVAGHSVRDLVARMLANRQAAGTK